MFVKNAGEVTLLETFEEDIKVEKIFITYKGDSNTQFDHPPI